MTRLKVTGITRPEDAAFAAAVGADMVACVFYASSPRYVTTARAWSIRRVLPPEVSMVGVFVDTPSPLVRRVIDQCQLDGAQLFGAEPRSEVEALAPWAFKAVSVSTAEDVTLAGQAFVDRRSSRPGNPGLLLHLRGAVTKRWEAASPLASRTTLILAGDGLDATSVGAAVTAVRPWAVDVWESVERDPGVLDHARFRSFAAALERARQIAGIGSHDASS